SLCLIRRILRDARSPGAVRSGMLDDCGCRAKTRQRATMKLTDFNTLTFDVMGTLMNYEAGFIAWFRGRAGAARPDISDQRFLERMAAEEERLQRETPNLPFMQMLPLMYLGAAKELRLAPDPTPPGSF